LPIQEQLVKVPRLMLTFKWKNAGEVPFFGKLKGFKFVRLTDYYQFDSDGRLVEHIKEPFRRGECWVELR